MVRQTSKWGQMFLLSLVGIGATALATAWLYRIDEVITVNGKLIPQNGGVEVKSPMAEQLSRVHVKSGQNVKSGEVLITYDVDVAKEQVKTLKEQIRIEERRIEDQLKNNKQRQLTVTRNIELSERILKRLIPLEEAGAISELQILNEANRLETQKDELIQLMTKKRTSE